MLKYYIILYDFTVQRGFPCGAVVKNLPANARDAGDLGSIPGSGRSPGEGNDNPFQYPCLGNPMDRGAWWATGHGVAMSQTRLSAAAAASHFSRVRLFATLWTVAHQAPLSMGFPRQEYWSGLPFPPAGDLLDPGIKHVSPALQVISCIAGRFFTN